MFITTPKLGSAGVYPAAAILMVLKQRFKLLNESQQAFAQVE